MRAVEALFVLGVLVLAVYVLWRIVRFFVSLAVRYHQASEPWELHEISDGKSIVMFAIKPNEEPLTIGSAAFVDNDFELQIEVLRAEGAHKIAALNSARKLLR